MAQALPDSLLPGTSPGTLIWWQNPPEPPRCQRGRSVEIFMFFMRMMSACVGMKAWLSLATPWAGKESRRVASRQESARSGLPDGCRVFTQIKGGRYLRCTRHLRHGALSPVDRGSCFGWPFSKAPQLFRDGGVRRDLQRIVRSLADLERRQDIMKGRRLLRCQRNHPRSRLTRHLPPKRHRLVQTGGGDVGAEESLMQGVQHSHAHKTGFFSDSGSASAR